MPLSATAGAQRSAGIRANLVPSGISASFARAFGRSACSGTDDFRAAIKPLLRWVRIEANDILTVCQGRRLQCDSLVTHDEAHKMIMAMGAVREGPPMRRFGRGDLDYQRFVWLAGENDAVLKPHYVREKEAA
jgi:hypothetical protein